MARNPRPDDLDEDDDYEFDRYYLDHGETFDEMLTRLEKEQERRRKLRLLNKMLPDYEGDIVFDKVTGKPRKVKD